MGITLWVERFESNSKENGEKEQYMLGSKISPSKKHQPKEGFTFM